MRYLNYSNCLLKNEINGAQMSQVGNVDKVALSFDVPRTYTVSQKGVKD